jgi:hypothetical protein
MLNQEADDERRAKEARGFQILLRLLDSDPDRAGQEFVALSRRLKKVIESNGADDPDTVFDVLIDVIFVRLADGLVIDSVFHYLGRAARFAAYDSAKKKTAQNKALDNLAVEVNRVQPPESREDSPRFRRGSE